MQRCLTIGSSFNHLKLLTISSSIQSSLPLVLLKELILKQRCMIHNNAFQSKSEPCMFNFICHSKPLIKFAFQNKQTRMVVARIQQKEHQWNYGERIFHMSWSYWKYSTMLILSLLELQTINWDNSNGGDVNPTRTHQMKAFNSNEKLGFVGDIVAMVEAIHSIMGWLEVASKVHNRVESRKDDKNKDSNEECNRGDAGELAHAADVIQHIIKRHAIVVFSKSYCPFCKKTKEIFRDASVRPQYVEIDQRDDGEHIQDALLKITGRRTVPQVFIYGAFVGGCSDLEKLKESGKLQEILKHMPP